MKVVCRDADGRSGYAAGHRASPARASTPAAIARRAAAQASRADEPSPSSGRASTRSCSSPTPSACCSSSSALARVQRPRARGGPRRARRAARRRGSPRRRSTSPTRRARRARCRARSTSRACRRTRCRSSRTASPTRVVHDRRSAARRRRRRALDRPRDRAGRLAVRARPDEPRAASAAARRTTPTLAAPIERGIYVTRLWYVNAVREKRDAADRHDARRHVPHRGRRASTRPLRDVRFTDSVLRHPRRAPRR